jgi:predicted DNA-binding transcriptional regulator YafY
MSPRPSVGPRLQRVLALVPYVLAHPYVTVAELAERFEISPLELERELELLPMCGLPPYTADRLIDVAIVDGEVTIRLAEYFERPLRLSPAEGLALLAAGRALLAVPGSDPDGPLGRALDKLSEVTRSAEGACTTSARTSPAARSPASIHVRPPFQPFTLGGKKGNCPRSRNRPANWTRLAFASKARSRPTPSSTGERILQPSDAEE